MTAKQCDKCKQYFNPNDYIRMGKVNIKTMNHSFGTVSKLHFDLCNTCTDKLRTWLMKGGDSMDV